MACTELSGTTLRCDDKVRLLTERFRDVGAVPQFWLGLQCDDDLMTFDTSQLGPIVPLTAGRPLTQA